MPVFSFSFSLSMTILACGVGWGVVCGVWGVVWCHV